MTPVKVIKKKPVDKKNKIDTFFQKIFNAFGKFCQNSYGKTRELGGLTSGIKRDGHKKKSGH